MPEAIKHQFKSYYVNVRNRDKVTEPSESNNKFLLTILIHEFKACLRNHLKVGSHQKVDKNVRLNNSAFRLLWLRFITACFSSAPLLFPNKVKLMYFIFYPCAKMKLEYTLMHACQFLLHFTMLCFKLLKTSTSKGIVFESNTNLDLRKGCHPASCVSLVASKDSCASHNFDCY